jgi:uncharacterized protein YdgA (DUF945 family)
MKKWAGFILAFVVLVLIGFYGAGVIIKNTLVKNINSLPKNPLFNVQVDKYQGGWFSSQAALSIKMQLPDQGPQNANGETKTDPLINFNIGIPILIKHGPFINTTNGLRFGLGLVTTEPETHYAAFINYLNRTVFSYNLAGFSLDGAMVQGEKNVHLNWQGLKSWASFSSNLDSHDGTFELLGFNTTLVDPSSQNVEINLGTFNADYNLKRYIDWLWIGRCHFGIKSTDMSLSNKKIFELAGLDTSEEVRVNNGLIDLEYKISLTKLYTNDQNYGPGTIHLILRNLDPVVAAKLNQQSFNLMQNNNNSLMMIGLMTDLPNLLAKGAELDLADLDVSLPEGKIVGRFKLTLPKVEGSSDFDQITKKAQGEGSLRVPMATVKTLMIVSIKSDLEKQAQNNPDTQNGSTDAPNPINVDTEAENQAEQQLKNLVSKGLLKIEGTDFVISIKIENQQLIVNGKSFNPGML